MPKPPRKKDSSMIRNRITALPGRERYRCPAAGQVVLLPARHGQARRSVTRYGYSAAHFARIVTSSPRACARWFLAPLAW
jgi:hypothetical protein